MHDKEAELILRGRAERLARAEGETEVAAIEPLVAFMVSGQCFGVRLDHVVYAGRLRHLTPLPGGSPYLLGITVLAGHLVSVLDVAAFLELRHHGIGDVTCCLVVQSGGREIGLAAEQLIGIEDVPMQRIAQVGSLNSAGSAAIVTRAALLDRFRILLIDLERMIGDPRLGKPRGDGKEGGHG
jgi:purine-binding chemotaxis protein CheW